MTNEKDYKRVVVSLESDAAHLRSLTRALKVMVQCVGVLPTRAQLEEYEALIDKTQNKETCDVKPSKESWEEARRLLDALKNLRKEVSA